jgi:ABC-type transport system involved in multi-copper enzyme maturation permease subunit
MTAVLRSEWTKLRSVRSTVWSMVVLVVLDLGFTALFAWLNASQWDKNDRQFRAAVAADPTSLILGSGLGFGQLAICVLGVMVITSEYATGTIRATLLAVPRRLPVLAAKSAVFAALVLVLGTAVSFASFFVGAPILHSHAPVSLDDPGVLRAVVGGGLYLAMLGLFALAIGAIVRHTAAGITLVVGVVLVLATVSRFLSGDIGRYTRGYLPSEAGVLVTHTHQGADDLFTPWQGYAVFAGWTVLLLVTAAVLLRRRDA